jgi:hypothetical protein
VALKQHTADLTQQYKQLSADYEQLHQIVRHKITDGWYVNASFFVVWSRERPASSSSSGSAIVLVQKNFGNTIKL